MASLTLTVDDSKVDAIVTAFELRFGPKLETETKGQFLERHIRMLIRQFVKNQYLAQVRLSAETAYDDPLPDLEPEP